MTKTDEDILEIAIRKTRHISTRNKKQKQIRNQLIKDIKNPTNGEYKRKPRHDKYIRDKNCPYSSISGLVIESHHVWWKNHPEDEIKYNEIIHHINLNPSDNRIENLMKIKSRDHKKLHGKIISKNNLKKWKKIG